MTGQELKDKVERYTDMTFKRDTIIDAIQESINKLGIRGHIIDTIDIEAESEEFYELPKDIIRVIKVEVPEDSVYYYDYLVDGNLIRFHEDNFYRIFAEKHPFKYQNLNEELELHPMLQDCILTYVKGYIRLSNDDKNEIGWNYMQQFREESMQAYEYLKRNQQTPSKIRVERRA